MNSFQVFLVCLFVLLFMEIANADNISNKFAVTNSKANDKTIFNQALKFYKNGDYSKAGKLFKYLVEKTPDNFSLTSSYAYCLFMQKNYQEANKQFQYILENSEDSKLRAYSKNIIKLIPENNFALVNSYMMFSNIKDFNSTSK